MSATPSPLQPSDSSGSHCTASQPPDLGDLPDRLVPDFIAHWVVKTARSAEMIDWYGHVFGARVVHEDNQIAFLTWDHESHRLALVKLPRHSGTSSRCHAGAARPTASTIWHSPSPRSKGYC